MIYWRLPKIYAALASCLVWSEPDGYTVWSMIGFRTAVLHLVHVWFGLLCVSFGLGLVWFRLGLLWIWFALFEFALGWLWFGLGLLWVGFDLVWVRLGLGVVWFGFASGWVWFVWVYFGLASVWFGLALGCIWFVWVRFVWVRARFCGRERCEPTKQHTNSKSDNCCTFDLPRHGACKSLKHTTI